MTSPLPQLFSFLTLTLRKDWCTICEPSHSTVQYPTADPDTGDPVVSKIEAGLGPKIFESGVEITGYIHFSSTGLGHSEAIQAKGLKTLHLPRDTKYETEWWQRVIKLDGKFFGPDYDKEYALQAATEYAGLSCIGDLKIFRRFLEASLNKSDRPCSYLIRFIENMLNQEGREQIHRKLVSVLGGRKGTHVINSFQKENILFDEMVRVIMGFTRKRQLLCPEWQDDENLWTPRKELVLLNAE